LVSFGPQLWLQRISPEETLKISHSMHSLHNDPMKTEKAHLRGARHMFSIAR